MCSDACRYSILIFKLFTLCTVAPVGVDHAAGLFAKKAISVCSSAGIAQSLSEEYVRSLFEKTSSASEVCYEFSEENKRQKKSFNEKEVDWFILN
jgi:hypothetical protein